MKQALFILSLILLMFNCTTTEQTAESIPDESDTIASEAPLPIGDNSRTSVDWNGTYTGIIPCADCAGIYTHIELDPDNSYNLVTQYLGKNGDPIVENGEFQWNDAGGKITLSGTNTTYLVGENVLIQRDMDGNPITGDLADQYRIEKLGYKVTDQYWRLIQAGGREVPIEGKANQPYLLMFGDTTRVVGHSGCNPFNGSYEMDGLKLSFSKMAITMMACINVNYESDYLKALENADNYTLNRSGDTLSLNRARMAPLAVFVADTPK